MEKLDLKSRVEMVRYALHQGWLARANHDFICASQMPV